MVEALIPIACRLHPVIFATDALLFAQSGGALGFGKSLDETKKEAKDGSSPVDKPKKIGF